MARGAPTFGDGARVALLGITLVLAFSIAGSQDEIEPGMPAAVLASGYTGGILATVTDDVGRIMKDAVVNLAGNASSWISNSTGQVYITGLLADSNGTSYDVWAEKTAYDPAPVTGVVVTPNNVTALTLVVSGGIIFGQVSDADGPIGGATVYIAALGYYNNTTAEGMYELEGLPGGTHSVTVSAAGYVDQSKVTTLETGGFQFVNFYMTSQTGQITGRILHSTTDEVLAGAQVAAIVGEVTITVLSDANGTYRIPSLPAGTYSLTASLAGFNSTTVDGVVVVANATTEGVDILLDEKPTSLYGVVKAGTLLLVGAHIVVEGTNFSANSSLEGEYTIRNISAGSYTVTATLEGYITTTVPGVVIPRGTEVRLDIVLVGLPGGLRGTVLDSASLDPLAGVTVAIVDAEPNQRTTITNINGEFQFTGVSAGNYTIRLSMEGYKPIEFGPVVITGDDPTNLYNITMDPTRESFGGFIFGFDLAHSMMILALLLTIVMLAFAVMLRIRTFEAPDKAPAVYDQEESQEAAPAKKEEKGWTVPELPGKDKGGP
ncbi:MAG: carboxypeptidase regulatory-like domain-containing protein [Thermoplasmata archaeon]|nr:carboxypeptidase regulatory-like domain-containing protein [Thermoplasmata archaeon]